jgi:hypothetical protein
LRRNDQKYFSWNHEPQGDLAYEKNISHYALPKENTQLIKQTSEQIKPAAPDKKIILRRPKEVNEINFHAKEKLIVIEKHYGKAADFENKIESQYSKSETNSNEIVTETKVKEIIYHEKAPINTNNDYNNCNQQNEYSIDFKAIPKTGINLEELKNQYNEKTCKNENIIKKVYRRDNNKNYNNNKNNRNNHFNDPNILNNNENRLFNEKFVRKFDQFYMKEDEKNLGNSVNCSEYNQSNRIFKPEVIPLNSVYYFKFSPNDQNNSLKENKNVIKTTPNVNTN